LLITWLVIAIVLTIAVLGNFVFDQVFSIKEVILHLMGKVHCTNL
jgi:hypothetical protein